MPIKSLVLVLGLMVMLPTACLGKDGATEVALGGKADLILVEKANRKLSVYSSGKVIRTYRVALGRSPIGAKEREGDNRTPEGEYIIDSRLEKSGYHLALHVSYPSPSDVARAKAGEYKPGNGIMIHGMKNGFGWLGSLHTRMDWTRGCIAVTNAEIEELWRLVPNGTRVLIKP